MHSAEYALLCLSSMFVIVDPIGLVPSFVAMTPRDTVATRVRMARLACAVGAVVLLGFALTGSWLFKVLGITLPALQIAGSIILLRIAIDMIQVRPRPAQQTHEEVEAGAEKADIAITPLAVPMLAGPGAISNVLILLHRASGWDQILILLGSIVIVFGASYLIFRLAARGVDYLNPLVMKVVTRLMGLLLAAIAMQFLINAVEALGWFQVPKAPG